MMCSNECFERAETSCSQKQAAITLTEKKANNGSLLDNWRPISLVNVDAKIRPNVIATRIKNVLPDIIHHNQTGFIEGWYISETVRSIFDIMDFTLKGKAPGLLILIDFQKAFDNFEWNFLFSCIEAFCSGHGLGHFLNTFKATLTTMD